MSTSKEYLDYILDQLSILDGISYRMMMGEYVLYFQGKVFGGLYDNTFLVKKTPSALEIMPEHIEEIPYSGAKSMIVIDDPENKDLLIRLIPSICRDLPAPKPKKKKKISALTNQK